MCECFPDTCSAFPDEGYGISARAQTDLGSKQSFANAMAASSASAGAGELTQATSLLQLLARLLGEE